MCADLVNYIVIKFTKNYIFSMNWFIKYLVITAIVIWLLVLTSCKHICYTECEDEEEFVHACPQAGHGACPICFDPQFNSNEKVVVLD